MSKENSNTSKILFGGAAIIGGIWLINYFAGLQKIAARLVLQYGPGIPKVEGTKVILPIVVTMTNPTNERLSVRQPIMTIYDSEEALKERSNPIGISEDNLAKIHELQPYGSLSYTINLTLKASGAKVVAQYALGTKITLAYEVLTQINQTIPYTDVGVFSFRKGQKPQA